MLAFLLIFLLSNLIFSFTYAETSIEGRIVGGNIASEKQFPYQIYIRYNDHFRCGGAIYNENYIITAAHCLTDEKGNKLQVDNLKIVAGTTKLNDKSSKALEVEKFVIHNSYRQRGNSASANDIALIKLKNKLQFSDSIKSIELYDGKDLKSGESVTVSGWGITSFNSEESNELRYTEMSSITSSRCSSGTRIYSRSLLCLSRRGRTICSGDSGGPATYNGKLVGIASFSGYRCSIRKPAGYTKIQYFKKWIQENAS